MLGDVKMPMMMGIGSIVAPIIGGGIGYLASSDDREAAGKLRQDALDKISSIQQPDLKELALKQYTQQGILTPEEEKAIKQDPSELKKIQVDERYKQAQMRSLRNLEDVGQTALNQGDRAALQETQLETDRAARARREGILQSLASRGMSGGGSELAAQLQAQQEEANRGASNSRDLTQQALARQLQAMQSAGNLGGQLREQEFGQQAKVAEAQDLINRFNTQFLQGAQERNVNRANLAQAQNLGMQQDIANRNVDVGNRQQMYNVAELPQQRFQNMFGIANAQSNALGNSASQRQQQAQNTQQAFSQIGSGVGSGMGAAGQMQGQQQALKMQESQLTPEQRAYYRGQ